MCAMFFILHYLERVGKNGSDQGLDRLNVAVCARFISFFKSSYCSHDHNFTLQSLKDKVESCFKKNLYLSNTTTVEDPKKHKACLFVNVFTLFD